MHDDLDHTPDGPQFGLRTMFGLVTLLCVVFGITSLLKMPAVHLPVAMAICGLTAWFTILIVGRKRRPPRPNDVRSPDERPEFRYRTYSRSDA